MSRGEFGRFWKYNNFHLRISLWKLLRPPVARYGRPLLFGRAPRVCSGLYTESLPLLSEAVGLIVVF